MKKAWLPVAVLVVFLPGADPSTPPARPAGEVRIAGFGACPVFPENNIWNTPVNALPLNPKSAAYIASIGSGDVVHADFGSGTWDGGPKPVLWIMRSS